MIGRYNQETWNPRGKMCHRPKSFWVVVDADGCPYPCPTKARAQKLYLELRSAYPDDQPFAVMRFDRDPRWKPAAEILDEILVGVLTRKKKK